MQGQPLEEKAQGFAAEAVIEEDVILLPGEIRAPRNPSAPREEFPRRDSARIGSNPRSRFQRPQRGGRDRDRGQGGDRGGRPTVAAAATVEEVEASSLGEVAAGGAHQALAAISGTSEWAP